jgi:hypothetical protein
VTIGQPTTYQAISTLAMRWRSAALPTRALLTALAAGNFVLLTITIYGFFVSSVGYDWLIFREAGQRALQGGLYDWSGVYAWSYSPLLAYVFAVIAPLGLLVWSALHFAVLGLLRDRSLAVITLLSWPFWVDVYNGNTMVFVMVAGVAALRGSQIETASYLTLCLLMPRPVMLPLLIWILWHQPAWRMRFAVLVVITSVAVAGTGQGMAWIQSLLSVTDAVAVSSRDIGPSLLLGRLWVPIGAVLAVLFLLRGRVGWASIAASPYWLPQYLLMLLLELGRLPGQRTQAGSLQVRGMRSRRELA